MGYIGEPLGPLWVPLGSLGEYFGVTLAVLFLKVGEKYSFLCVFTTLGHHLAVVSSLGVIAAPLGCFVVHFEGTFR